MGLLLFALKTFPSKFMETKAQKAPKGDALFKSLVKYLALFALHYHCYRLNDKQGRNCL